MQVELGTDYNNYIYNIYIFIDQYKNTIHIDNFNYINL